MNERTNADEVTKREFVVGVPDTWVRLLVVQLALARGLEAHVPGRSQKRVVVVGDEPRVRALVAEARRLAATYHTRCLEALEKLLQENGLPVPLKLATKLGLEEAKAALAAAGLVPVEQNGATPVGRR